MSLLHVTNVHHFKKELKTKYKATKAICGKYPFGTEILLYIMQKFPGGGSGNTLITFYNMVPADKVIWERIYEDLVMAMLFLNNSRNDEAKKELRCSYANGNTNAYHNYAREDGTFIIFPISNDQRSKQETTVQE